MLVVLAVYRSMSACSVWWGASWVCMQSAVAVFASVLSVGCPLVPSILQQGAVCVLAAGMAGGSVFVSLAVLAVVLAVNAFTIMILIHAGDKYKQFELG